jgi:hypothetical protein
MLQLLLSYGALNALIPLFIILIVLAAAAGISRGYDIFSILGIGVLAGVGKSAGGRGSFGSKTAYRAKMGYSTGQRVVGSYFNRKFVKTKAAKAGTTVNAKLGSAKRTISLMKSGRTAEEALANDMADSVMEVKKNEKLGRGYGRIALGILLSTITLGGLLGERQLARGRYERAVRKYKEAEARGDTYEMDKWRAKIEEMEGHGYAFGPKGNPDLEGVKSAKEAIDLEVFKMKHTTSPKPKKVEKFKKTIEKLSEKEILGEEMEILNADYRGGTITKSQAQAETARLANEYYERKGRFAKTAIESRVQVHKTRAGIP